MQKIFSKQELNCQYTLKNMKNNPVVTVFYMIVFVLNMMVLTTEKFYNHDKKGLWDKISS